MVVLPFVAQPAFSISGQTAVPPAGWQLPGKCFSRWLFMPPSVLCLAKDLSETLHQRVGIHMELWDFTSRQSKLLRREVPLYSSH